MPRLIQRALAGIGLLVLGPLILGLALAVRATSRGPAFHCAPRSHPRGTFVLYKLRTMRADAAATGPGITAGGDARVTRLGRGLRRWKLDELPQLWNVVRGDMLLVGPRPEDPRYVDLSDPLHARVFGATPGITSLASVAYRDEERLLATAGPGDLDRVYREEIQPAKLRLDARYLDSRSPGLDLALLVSTVTGRQLDPDAITPRTSLFTEWGGRTWSSLVDEGFAAVGDLTGARVLEIGSRSGRMASLLALHGATVVGIDIADGFEAAAADEARSHGVSDRVQFRHDDGLLGSVDGEVFDLVFAKSVLVVVPDREQYLERIRERLVPGGRLLAIENGRGGQASQLLRRLRRRAWDHHRVDYFDDEAVQSIGALFRLDRVRRTWMPPVYLVVATHAVDGTAERP